MSGLGLVYPHQDRFTLSDGRYLVGAVVASLFWAMFSELRHIGKSMIASVIVWHASILVFATLQSLYLSMAILAVTGAGFASTQVFMLSSLLGNSRFEFRGLVMSLRSLAIYAFALGSMTSGATAGIWSAPVAATGGDDGDRFGGDAGGFSPQVTPTLAGTARQFGDSLV